MSLPARPSHAMLAQVLCYAHAKDLGQEVVGQAVSAAACQLEADLGHAASAGWELTDLAEDIRGPQQQQQQQDEKREEKNDDSASASGPSPSSSAAAAVAAPHAGADSNTEPLTLPGRHLAAELAQRAGGDPAPSARKRRLISPWRWCSG